MVVAVATAAQEAAAVVEDTVAADPTGTMTMEVADTALTTTTPMGTLKGLGALAASVKSNILIIYISAIILCVR